MKGKKRNLKRATLQFPASHQILIIVDSLHRERNCLGDLRTQNAFLGSKLILKWKLFYYSADRFFECFHMKTSRRFRQFVFSRKKFLFRVKSCHATFLLYKSDGTRKHEELSKKAAGKTIVKEIEKVLNIPFQFVANVRGSAKKT